MGHACSEKQCVSWYSNVNRVIEQERLRDRLDCDIRVNPLSKLKRCLRVQLREALLLDPQRQTPVGTSPAAAAPHPRFISDSHEIFQPGRAPASKQARGYWMTIGCEQQLTVTSASTFPLGLRTRRSSATVCTFCWSQRNDYLGMKLAHDRHLWPLASRSGDCKSIIHTYTVCSSMRARSADARALRAAWPPCTHACGPALWQPTRCLPVLSVSLRRPDTEWSHAAPPPLHHP